MEENNQREYVKIGKRYKMANGNEVYEWGGIPDCPGIEGWGCICFKDEEIFLNEPDEICYMSESNFFNSFEEDLPRFIVHTIMPETRFSRTKESGCWTANDFIRDSRNFVKYVPAYHNLDPVELAHRVFLAATWTMRKETRNFFAQEAAKMLEEQEAAL